MANEPDKILLILDLDETLIYASKAGTEAEPDAKVFGYKVYKRPYLDEFLVSVSRHFKLAVWSTASEDYIQQIISELFPKNISYEFVWGSGKATLRLTKTQNHKTDNSTTDNQYVKRLKKVKQLGFTLEKMLIVDDSPDKLIDNYGNAIYIKEFKGDLTDNELLHLEKYLLSLRDLDNVRTIEKRNWRENL
ncbi:MAG TPA: HAD family hydrolase [Draconibacterium sp.]|nr:HAD family hydrolase [Draconibacterium sp.]